MNNISNIEKYLKDNKILTYTFKGVSMEPMLKQGRDLFTVTLKTSNRCKKHDVVLYKKTNDQYVLHRIIEVRDKDYITMGDNSINKEYGIKDEDIIGVMVGFTHNGKKIKVTDFRYKMYVFVLEIMHPIIIKMKQFRTKMTL